MQPETPADSTPEMILLHSEVARGLEQTLVEAMVACQGEAGSREERWGQRCHEMIMRRFRRVLEENPDRALYIPEILRRYWRAGPDVAVVLPGTSADGAEAISAAAPHSSGAKSVASGRCECLDGYRYRYDVRVLAFWQICHFLPFRFWGITVRDVAATTHLGQQEMSGSTFLSLISDRIRKRRIRLCVLAAVILCVAMHSLESRAQQPTAAPVGTLPAELRPITRSKNLLVVSKRSSTWRSAPA